MTSEGPNFLTYDFLTFAQGVSHCGPLLGTCRVQSTQQVPVFFFCPVFVLSWFVGLFLLLVLLFVLLWLLLCGLLSLFFLLLLYSHAHTGRSHLTIRRHDTATV
ncbi:unnamed protein product [Polarella glacialis]|uniref:Uncharacterized protein n=1 Tax=Polarella glacialis TaxID=89957 RepID=A0A813EGX0_POLGL|nr:unnamed protein product [Polarella glacialis]